MKKFLDTPESKRDLNKRATPRHLKNLLDEARRLRDKEQAEFNERFDALVQSRSAKSDDD